MGLFSREKPYDAEFIIQVVSFFGMGGVAKDYQRQVSSFFEKNGANRIKTLSSAAALINTPSTTKELYAVSKAYVWAGAKYRKEAIKYLKEYIKAGAYWEGLSNSYYYEPSGINISQADVHRSFVFTDLGDALEGEYEFDEAIEAFQDAINLAPHMIHNYIKQSGVYAKVGKIEEGISVLKRSKKQVPKSDIELVNGKIADLADKLARGYVYKPRKHSS